MNIAGLAIQRTITWCATVFLIGGFPIIAQLLHRLFVPGPTLVLWDTADGWFYTLVVATAVLTDAGQYATRRGEGFRSVIVVFLLFVFISVFGFVSISFYVPVSAANAWGIQLCGVFVFLAVALSSIICIYIQRLNLITTSSNDE